MGGVYVQTCQATWGSYAHLHNDTDASFTETDPYSPLWQQLVWNGREQFSSIHRQAKMLLPTAIVPGGGENVAKEYERAISYTLMCFAQTSLQDARRGRQ